MLVLCCCICIVFPCIKVVFCRCFASVLSMGTYSFKFIVNVSFTMTCLVAQLCYLYSCTYIVHVVHVFCLISMFICIVYMYCLYVLFICIVYMYCLYVLFICIVYAGN